MLIKNKAILNYFHEKLILFIKKVKVHINQTFISDNTRKETNSIMR